MLDMLIQGGRVVTPAGVGDGDVGIEGEKIVAVAFPGVLPAAATQVIDARGKILVDLDALGLRSYIAEPERGRRS